VELFFLSCHPLGRSGIGRECSAISFEQNLLACVMIPGHLKWYLEGFFCKGKKVNIYTWQPHQEATSSSFFLLFFNTL
jgi:hypothetical protein